KTWQKQSAKRSILEIVALILILDPLLPVLLPMLFDALLLLIRTVFHHQIPHTNLHQLHRVPLLTCAPYVTPILEDNKKENNGYSLQYAFYIYFILINFLFQFLI